MLNHKVVKVFDSAEVFKACYEHYGYDIEDDINEVYDPSSGGAVRVDLPFKNKNFDSEEYYEAELDLFNILHYEGGIEWGGYCYLEFHD